jgi:hypothetical protein
LHLKHFLKKEQHPSKHLWIPQQCLHFLVLQSLSRQDPFNFAETVEQNFLQHPQPLPAALPAWSRSFSRFPLFHIQKITRGQTKHTMNVLQKFKQILSPVFHKPQQYDLPGTNLTSSSLEDPSPPKLTLDFLALAFGTIWLYFGCLGFCGGLTGTYGLAGCVMTYCCWTTIGWTIGAATTGV